MLSKHFHFLQIFTLNLISYTHLRTVCDTPIFLYYYYYYYYLSHNYHSFSDFIIVDTSTEIQEIF